MRRQITHSISAIAVIGAAGLFTATLPSLAQTPAAPAPNGPDAPLATFKQYCQGCHNDKAKTGGVSFEGVSAGSVGKDPELFEKAVRKLRGRVMPPPGAKQPDGKTVDSLVTYLEGSLD